MDREDIKTDLKRQLLKDVALFYKQDNHKWKQPVVETLRELYKSNLSAVFFGGTLRSLLAARVFDNKLGRPRDVDIVTSGASLDFLKSQFNSIISRETRFGGLQLRRRHWQFDVWPIQDTWAFVEDHIYKPEFTDLPLTTFFNLEAIAVEVWPQPGMPRKIFSGDDQFFDGIINRTLEINREDNPFPQLCVVRALVMSSSHSLKIGPALAHYIARHGHDLNEAQLDEIQYKHYGQRRRNSLTLQRWIRKVSETYNENPLIPVSIFTSPQLQLWEDPVTQRFDSRFAFEYMRHPRSHHRKSHIALSRHQPQYKTLTLEV